MSRELIEKAREIDRRLPEGPWQVEGTSASQADIADSRGNWIATIRKDFDEGDDPLIIELRTLLPALADLAESEGRRADEERKRAGNALLDVAMRTEERDIVELEFNRVRRELARLKGQQP